MKINLGVSRKKIIMRIRTSKSYSQVSKLIDTELKFFMENHVSKAVNFRTSPAAARNGDRKGICFDIVLAALLKEGFLYED